jgi:hypothetical protein
VKRFQNIILLAIATLALSGLTGCSSISVNYDYDNTADFMAYKTFGWVEADAAAPVDADASSGLLDKRIRSAIATELGARGMTEKAGDPDLLVVFHLGSKDKIQVTDWGYRYSSYYWGYGGRNIDVYSYTEGQLIIDLVDAQRKELVWRGSGTKVISNSKKSPEQLQAAINEAVNKIMQSYPPKVKK